MRRPRVSGKVRIHVYDSRYMWCNFMRSQGLLSHETFDAGVLEGVGRSSASLYSGM